LQSIRPSRHRIVNFKLLKVKKDFLKKDEAPLCMTSFNVLLLHQNQPHPSVRKKDKKLLQKPSSV